MSNPAPRAGFQTIPRLTGFDGHRRDLAPGLYEFTRDTKLTGDKGVISYVNALQSSAHCEKLLTSKQERHLLKTQGGGVKVDIGNCPANGELGEDRFSMDVVDMKAVKEKLSNEGTWWGHWHDLVQAGSGKDDILMLSMFDGHVGAHVADIMQKTLHACIAWAIANDPQAAAGEKEAILRIMSKTYTSVNQDLSLTVDRASRNPGYMTGTDIPGMPSIAQLAITAFEAGGGACATTALVYRGKLYTAGMGDCRVIAIWQKEEWEAECMFADHNGFNMEEVKKVQDAHPNDPEAMMPTPKEDTLYYRVKGGSLVTRAMGDIAYNRTQDERDKLSRDLLTRSEWPKFPTIENPYLSWTPDVAVRDAKDLRFLILSSDGLFDRMTSAEAANGVIAHSLNPLQRDIPWPSLSSRYPFKPLGKHLAEEIPGYENGHWCFEDDNAGVHLMRNAFGGGDRGFLRQMLSLCSGTRTYRDDTTVMVADLVCKPL